MSAKTLFLLAEVVNQERDAPKEPNSAMLLADAARPASAALHRHKQHDHAENIAEHGGRGLRLHVTLPPRRPRVGRLLPRREDETAITLAPSCPRLSFLSAKLP